MKYQNKNRHYSPDDVHINCSFCLQVKTFYIHIYLTRPKSKGFVRLNSKDYKDDPVVDPRYLTDYDDVKTIVSGEESI